MMTMMMQSAGESRVWLHLDASNLGLPSQCSIIDAAGMPVILLDMQEWRQLRFEEVPASGSY